MIVQHAGQRFDETELIERTPPSRPSPVVTVVLLSLALLAGTALVILVGFGPF